MQWQQTKKKVYEFGMFNVFWMLRELPGDLRLDMWNIPTKFTVRNVRHKPLRTVAFLQSQQCFLARAFIISGTRSPSAWPIPPLFLPSSSSSSSSLTYRKSALLFRPKSAQSKRLAFCLYKETRILPSTSNPPNPPHRPKHQ